jgi:(E)-4-hydroxy-3-methylbut-2-enyl-diphosphate synthase
VETLVEEALRLADQMGADLPDELRDCSRPDVTVH